MNVVDAISKGQWGICSSPLKGDRDNSAYHKRRWLEDNDLMPPAIENVIFTGQKEHYAINSIDGSPLVKYPISIGIFPDNPVLEKSNSIIFSARYKLSHKETTPSQLIIL